MPKEHTLTTKIGGQTVQLGIGAALELMRQLHDLFRCEEKAQAFNPAKE
jgi:hypothetical protein